MADFLTLKNSGHFWDNTKNIPHLLDVRSGYNMDNTAGKGASTLFSLLRYYADHTLADPAHFAGLAMAEDPHFQKHLGKYRVFLLDFSDYRGTTVEDTVDYLYRKAEDLYRRNADLYYPEVNVDLARTAAAIHSRSLDVPSLCKSFTQLIDRARFGGLHRPDTLLLVDNAVLIEAAAEKADGKTQHQLMEMLRDLLPPSLPSYCDKLIIANSLPYEDPWGDYRYTCCNFDLFPLELANTTWRDTFLAVPREHQYAVADPPPQPVSAPAPYERWETFFQDLVRLADEEEARRARQAAIAREKQRQRYLLPPPADFPKISPNIGARSFSVPTDTPQYQARNKVLQGLYNLHCKSSDDLYEAMQKVDQRHPTDVPDANWDEDPLRDAFLPLATARGWHIQTYHSEYWLQYNFYPPGADRNNCGEYVKAYISFAGKAVCPPFQALTLHLLQGAQEDFVIKVTQYVRKDMVCCWLRSRDLPLLKDYALQHAEELIQPLPFVPYWNGIGLSRELMDSYNRTLSQIFFHYFSTVPNADSVSLLEMLDGYVRDWNQYDPENGWRKDDVLAFLLVLDSFSILLGDLRPEDSFLLRYDESAWRAMEDARCWDDLNRSHRY